MFGYSNKLLFTGFHIINIYTVKVRLPVLIVIVTVKKSLYNQGIGVTWCLDKNDDMAYFFMKQKENNRNGSQSSPTHPNQLKAGEQSLFRVKLTQIKLWLCSVDSWIGIEIDVRHVLLLRLRRNSAWCFMILGWSYALPSGEESWPSEHGPRQN